MSVDWTDNRPRRAIDRDDFLRAHAVIYALDLKSRDNEHRPLWLILREFYEMRDPQTMRVTLDDIVGDEAARREITHALHVLETLAGGDLNIHDRPTRAPKGVCATADCDNETFATYCLSCELLRGMGRS